MFLFSFKAGPSVVAPVGGNFALEHPAGSLGPREIGRLSDSREERLDLAAFVVAE